MMPAEQDRLLELARQGGDVEIEMGEHGPEALIGDRCLFTIEQLEAVLAVMRARVLTHI